MQSRPRVQVYETTCHAPWSAVPAGAPRDPTRLALVETYRRGVGTALAVVAVMDGAGWRQRFVDAHRPDAIRILDVPHAVESLARASAAHEMGNKRGTRSVAA